MDPKTRLDQIAKSIKNGADPEDFQDELDQILGTGMSKRDTEEEARWEEDYRNRDE